jgi:hypothetical protein
MRIDLVELLYLGGDVLANLAQRELDLFEIQFLQAPDRC